LAQRDIADFVLADAHDVFLGADVPAVGGVIGVEVRQILPVAGRFGVLVGLEPAGDPIVELFA
jgi:hypothetical protein